MPDKICKHEILAHIDELADFCRVHGLSHQADRLDRIAVFAREELAGSEQFTSFVTDMMPEGVRQFVETEDQ